MSNMTEKQVQKMNEHTREVLVSCGRDEEEIQEFFNKLNYDKVFGSRNGFARVSIGDKWGLIDPSGEEICEIKYDRVGTFNDAFAAVKLNNKWGFINEKGKEICKIKYDRVGTFKDGFAIVELNNKRGFINEKGEEICEVKYDGITSFKYGPIVPVKLNGKWGFINEKGEEICDIKYDDVSIFNDGFAPVKLNGKWALINSSGKEICEFKYYSIKSPYNKLAFAKFMTVKNNDIIPIHVLIDSSGNEIETIEIGDTETYIAMNNNGKLMMVFRNNALFFDEYMKEVSELKKKLFN